MEYISAAAAAEKWGVSERQVQRLLAAGRIPGTGKFGRAWVIPAEADKPPDPRRVDGPEWRSPPFLLVTLPRDGGPLQPPRGCEALAEADMAFRQGNPAPALECWRKTPPESGAFLSVATLATAAAISGGDYAAFTEILRLMAQRKAAARSPEEGALQSLPEALAAVSMALPSMTPDWLQEGDFSLFPRSYAPFLVYLYALHLRNIRDRRGVLATAEASVHLCGREDTFTWMDVYNLMLCAACRYYLGDTRNAGKNLLAAADLGLPWGFIAPFSDYLGSLGGLMDEYVYTRYPQHRKPIENCWSSSFRNWMTFHNRFSRENITTILTPPEYQVASLASNGASYGEIAVLMHLSAGRIKNILAGIYEKLGIQKKAELKAYIL